MSNMDIIILVVGGVSQLAGIYHWVWRDDPANAACFFILALGLLQ